MKKAIYKKEAFTLIELLVVIAIIAILASILMPVLSSAKNKADQIYCLNNMRQWGLAFHMYCDDNNNFVPEEGDVEESINWGGSATTTPNYTMAWYNVIPPEIGIPSLATLYGAGVHQPIPPLPNSHSLFSCPSAPMPVHADGYGTAADPTPTVQKAFFMYGENCRLCVNWSTRYKTTGPTGVQQTKLITVIKPSQTVFLAEVDPNATDGATDSGGAADSSVGMSQSCVSAFYAMARHMKNTLSNLAMCDGSAISAKTNDFWETQSMADGNTSSPLHSGQQEWQTDHKIYWYPSPTTPE